MINSEGTTEPGDRARMPAWQLDELAFAGRENLDPTHAAAYDEKENSDAEAEVALVRQLGVGAESVVVELGTGTGQFAVAVAPHCRRVLAVDVSSVMLAQLEAKLDRLGVTNVDLVRSGFLSYDHQGPPVELVYSRYALHHLPDFWKVGALRRIHAMLRPGGVFRLVDLVYGFEPDQTERHLDAWCATLPPPNPAAAAEGEPPSWNRADIEEHIRDEHSTYSWLLETMLDRIGFSVEDSEFSDDRILAKYVLRRR